MVGTLLKKCKNLSGKLNDLLAANQKGLKIETPSTMNKDLVLKPYQKRGLHWYTQIHQMKMGGILADEMGLGKTVQTISFLAWLKLNQPSFTRPHLVVCPSSTLENWKREFECWLPSFKIHLYYGEHRYVYFRIGIHGPKPFSTFKKIYKFISDDMICEKLFV